MILPQHLPHFERLRGLGAFRSPMLMLGNQKSFIGRTPADFFGVAEYTTLDPDGGDVALDLAGDVSALHGKFGCVFNLGTIEHIWDVHAAYCNAARLVKVGGVFLGHSPVGGWERHGVHVTDAGFIRSFFEMNGFAIDEAWHALKDGRHLPDISRGGGCQTLWIMATKRVEVERFVAPQQKFIGGRKVA